MIICNKQCLMGFQCQSCIKQTTASYNNGFVNMVSVNLWWHWGVYVWIVFSAVKMKLLRGMYGPGVSVNHNSGLGSGFDGGVPSDIQSASWIAKHKRAASWECARPIPSWHNLLGPCERGAGPQTALLASPWGPSERRHWLSPRTVKLFLPSAYWGMWHGPYGVGCVGVRVA